MKRILLILVPLLVLAGGAWWYLQRDDQPAANSETAATQQETTETPQEQLAEDSFNKQLHPIDEPGSIWWVVNKKRPLPEGYVPNDLIIPDVKLRLAPSHEQMQYSATAHPSLKAMFAAAEADGVYIVFGSGYRSYELQKQFYDSYVAMDGQAAADRYSARPGTSEHQTGLSFDATASNGACHLEVCFEETPEGAWLKQNAHKFGYIVRYPQGKEDITGYQYEPWHMRYVGEELATEMHETGVKTLEEFFGLPAANSYN